MLRIAHISDLHFCRTDPEAVEALATELNADPPDLVAVSGDLTMRARSREFRAARAFLDRLRAGARGARQPRHHLLLAARALPRPAGPLAPLRRRGARAGLGRRGDRGDRKSTR